MIEKLLKISDKRKWTLSFTILFLLAVVWFIFSLVQPSEKSFLPIAILIGCMMSVGACSSLNMFYLVPLKNGYIQFLFPGALSPIVTYYLFSEDLYTLSIFGSFALLNFVLGVFWLFISLRSKSLEK